MRSRWPTLHGAYRKTSRKKNPFALEIQMHSRIDWKKYSYLSLKRMGKELCVRIARKKDESIHFSNVHARFSLAERNILT
jgi:hypothetical protein